jgi:hypothetical protein
MGQKYTYEGRYQSPFGREKPGFHVLADFIIANTAYVPYGTG